MGKTTYSCIDAHTCGNPVRVVAGGGPVLKGDSIFEKREHFLAEYDWVRKGLMFEPRGHDMMSGSILYPASDPENDRAILFIETSGCLPMCGHGTIGTVTVAIEEGLIQPKVKGQLKLETPAGLVEVNYAEEQGKVTRVRLTNVSSYLAASNCSVVSDTLGEIFFDVAYGGNFYAIIDPQQNFKGLEHFSASELIACSREIRTKINANYSFQHIENSKIAGVSHLQWTGAALSKDSTARNAVFYGDKAIDRSPCGTGTSARMAQWFAKGKLKVGDEFIHESIIGSVFKGRVEAVAQIGKTKAIVPSVEGWARVTGYNTLFIDDADPYAQGFQVV